MKRSKDYLEKIKQLVEFSYSGGYGGSLDVNNHIPFNPYAPALGYCYKYTNGPKTIYKVCTSPLGLPDTDLRILLHEYGHIYLRHLEYSDEYNELIEEAITNNKADLIDYVNKACGIDWAEEFLDRVLNDPGVNHEIHNVAMDLEVNSKILSDDDVQEMECDISSKLPDYETKVLKELSKNATDKELKKKIDDFLKEAEKENKIKLMLPSRFHYPDGTPWPNELSYQEYLVLMMTYPDQYIKMMASVANGGSGDTEGVSQEDIQNASQGQGQSQGSSLDNLRKNSSVDSKQFEDQDPNKPDDKSSGKDGDGGSSKDHQSPERKKAEESLGSQSRGTGGHNEAITILSTDDKVDMALNEIIRTVHHRVVKINYKKDPLYTYNRGINRSVIAPTMRTKYQYDVNPRIVFLIDVSGSMPSNLISRFMTTISTHLKKINGGLKYDVIYWDTRLCKHYKDLDPKKPIPPLYSGGCTEIASGIRYFRENYSNDAILVIASDFYDSLSAWHREESQMSGYEMFGLDYGNSNYDEHTFDNLKVRRIPVN